MATPIYGLISEERTVIERSVHRITLRKEEVTGASLASACRHLPELAKFKGLEVSDDDEQTVLLFVEEIKRSTHNEPLEEHLTYPHHTDKKKDVS